MTQGEKVGMGDALEDFLSFGRPKEGSDRYKAAWDRLREEVAELRAKVASLEKDAADHCEALTIMHGIGYNSRNDEVRALQAERDEARGLQLKWIPCSERLPECKQACESMWGGTARSDTCLVLYADDPKHWDEPGPHISTGFLLDYSDGEEKCFEWMYPIDRTGGLERCSSHGGPVPIAWMPLPEGTSP